MFSKYIMSLQNLLKQNNYELVVGSITVDNIVSEDITTDIIYQKSSPGDEIFDISGNALIPDPPNPPVSIVDSIVPFKSIIPAYENTLTLGRNGLKFKELHISEIYGPTTSINVQNSLSGATNNDALELQNGFIMTVPSPPVSGTNQSIFNKYYELTSDDSSVATVSGPFSAPYVGVKFRAVRIGNFVSLRMLFPKQVVSGASVSSFLSINSFPALFNQNFLPTSPNESVCFTIPIYTGNGDITALAKIVNTGTISISNLNGSQILFSNTNTAGFAQADTDYIEVGYSI